MEKLIEPSFSLIDQYKGNSTFVINDQKSELNGLSLVLRISGDEVRFTSSGKRHINIDDQSGIDTVLGNDNTRLFARNLLITGMQLDANQQRYEYKYSGVISSVSTFEDPPTSYWRLLVLAPKSLEHFSRFFKGGSFKTEKKEYYNNILSINLSGEKFHMYVIDYEGKDYVVIDSLTKIPFSGFSHNSHSILLGLGFITGVLPGGIGVYVSSREASFNGGLSFSLYSIRAPIGEGYSLIHTNPHSFIREKERANKYYGRLNPITHDSFSSLCQKITEDERFRNIVGIVIEAYKQSIEVRAICYSVGIETMTNIISKEAGNTINPIKEKKRRKHIIAGLKKHLPALDTKLTKNEIEFAERRIEQIHNPTNIDKLTIPFERYHIRLSADDIETIKKRNILLHGNFIGTGDSANNGEVSFKATFLVALHLHSLLTRLMLKYIGYQGYVVNYLKVHESSLGRTDENDEFIEI
ncbi:MAG: hypothetical protein KAU50_07945 [Candidatus Marinimicrobia bacterium]|nr:hypothetical protein [Candidatus Neomarinimicrobiota bacterium]